MELLREVNKELLEIKSIVKLIEKQKQDLRLELYQTRAELLKTKTMLDEKNKNELKFFEDLNKIGTCRDLEVKTINCYEIKDSEYSNVEIILKNGNIQTGTFKVDIDEKTGEIILKR